jgi:site-specific recombinase XerD
MLNKYLIDFLEYLHMRGKKDTTARNYHLYLDRFINFTGDISPSELTAKKIIDFQMYISGNGFGGATANYHSVALRSFLAYLHKIGIQTISPESVELPKYQKKEAVFLTKTEIHKLLESCRATGKRKLKQRALMEVLAASGIRVHELTSLRVEDVNFKKREMIIYNGKGGKTRPAFLSHTALIYLKKHIEKNNIKNEDKIFKITDREVQRIIRIYSKKAQITKKITPHTLRHSLATNLLQGGVDIRNVQGILGHKNLNTTQIYTHLTDNSLHKAYDSASKKDENKVIQLLNKMIKNQEVILQLLQNKI